MEEGLSVNNILDAKDVDNLFTEMDDVQDAPEPEETQESESEDNSDSKKEKETTEVNTETLFEEPESVSSEDIDIEGEEDTDSKEGGTSPKNNFYSSIAKALKDEGVFPDLDEEIYDSIKKPEDFRALVEGQIQAGIDESYKRVNAALGYGVEPNEIKKYESTLNYLRSVNEQVLTDESEHGDNVRKQLIFQDFINRGYTKERAQREVQKSFNAGTDIDDAREALQGNAEYFIGKYNNLIQQAKNNAERAVQIRKQQAAELKQSILSDKETFANLNVDKNTRQKVFDNISKPVYKDPDTGEIFTAIQKYERENRNDFLKNVSLIFTLTNGFKDFNGLIKGKVNNEMKKGLRDLESRLNNTARTSDGNLKFATGVEDDPESYLGKGWKLDI